VEIADNKVVLKYYINNEKITEMEFNNKIEAQKALDSFEEIKDLL
jgi:hypothetical protein